MEAGTGGASPSVLRNVANAGVAGLLGAVSGGVVVQLGNPALVRSAGGIVGLESVAVAWVTLTALGVLFAIPFVAVVSGSVNAFVEMVIAITSGSDVLRSALVPLLHVSALGLTLFAIGLVYGLALGVALFAIGVPVWAILEAERTLPPTFLDIVGIVACTVYGGVLGLCYGLLEDG